MTEVVIVQSKPNGGVAPDFVSVEVRYSGHAVEREFAPDTRVGRVRCWAVNALGISPSEAAGLVLRGADSSAANYLQPLGSLADATDREVVFELVRNT